MGFSWNTNVARWGGIITVDSKPVGVDRKYVEADLDFDIWAPTSYKTKNLPYLFVRDLMNSENLLNDDVIAWSVMSNMTAEVYYTAETKKRAAVPKAWRRSA